MPSEKYYCFIQTLSIKSKNIYGQNPRKHSHLSEQTLYTYNIVTADEEFCNCQQVYRCTKHRYRQRWERCELVNHHSFEIWTLVKQLFFFLFLCCWDVDTCQTFFSDLCLSNIFLGRQLVKHCFKMGILHLSLFQKVGICQTSFCWVVDTCHSSFKLLHCYALYTWKKVTVASNPFPYTRSYVQQMQNLVQKLLCEEKQKVLKKKKEKKAGWLEWSAPEAEVSPHRKMTPVWQAAQAIVCDVVFATLGEQNMSAHPSILAGKRMVGQVLVIISTYGHWPQKHPSLTFTHTMSMHILSDTRPCNVYNLPDTRPCNVYNLPDTRPCNVYNLPDSRPCNVYNLPDSRPCNVHTMSMHNLLNARPCNVYNLLDSRPCNVHTMSMHNLLNARPCNVYNLPDSRPCNVYNLPDSRPCNANA